MIGTKQRGTVVTTSELELDHTVDVDGMQFEVQGVTRKEDGSAVVMLSPVIAGADWALEVGAEDWDEPMWELV